MSYQDKIKGQIMGGEPLSGDIRRFNLIGLLAIAEEADKELEAKEYWYKDELESYKQASKDEFDKREALEKELKAKDKLIEEIYQITNSFYIDDGVSLAGVFSKVRMLSLTKGEG